MKEIDQSSWPRRKHFEIFNTFDYPHFNLCANLDVTHTYNMAKTTGFSLNISLVYIISRTANELTEFRWRIRDNSVVEHEVVHPSTSIMNDDNLFSFCTINYDSDFKVFVNEAEKTIAYRKLRPTLEDEPGQDDLLFLSGIPWVSFTGLTHPIHMHPADSSPRFSWGKIFRAGQKRMLPFSVQVNHALMDGFHVGRYYQRLQAFLENPESWMK